MGREEECGGVEWRGEVGVEGGKCRLEARTTLLLDFILFAAMQGREQHDKLLRSIL